MVDGINGVVGGVIGVVNGVVGLIFVFVIGGVLVVIIMVDLYFVGMGMFGVIIVV